MAPAVAPFVAQDMQNRALGFKGLGVNNKGTSPSGALESEGKQFLNWGEWFSAGGKRELQETANNIDGFDPDLIAMSLPLVTKVRWQRERNYKRALAERKGWFERALKRNGHVHDWF